MNLPQKITIWIGAVIIVVMLLFPPWERIYESGDTTHHGFHWINYWGGIGPFIINTELLIIQIFAAIAITTGLVISFKSK